MDPFQYVYLFDALSRPISKFQDKIYDVYLTIKVKKIDYYDIMTNIDKPKWYKRYYNRLKK